MLPLLLLLLSPAWAGRYSDLADDLGLSSAERAKVEDILYQYRLSQTDLKASLKRAKLELRHALAAEALDEKAVGRAVEAVNSATSALVKARVDQIVALRKTLTPAQWAELKERWEEDDDDDDDDEDEDDD